MPITLKDMSVFPGGHSSRREAPILSRLNCTFHNDEITLVVGQVGSGKSTLIDTIGALKRPDEGTVYFNENSAWNGRKRNGRAGSRIGMVFQAPAEQLFAKSVLAEFKYSLRNLRLSETELQHRAAEALNSVGLSPELLKSSPLYLSHGQKRRVVLATTFAARPDWLLLDEPTAGLDPVASSQFIDYLMAQKKICSGGMIIATHDLDAFLPVANRVLILKLGKIAADVTPEQLLENPGLWDSAQIGLPSAAQLTLHLEYGQCPIQLDSFQPEAAAKTIAENVKQCRASGLALATKSIRGEDSHQDVDGVSEHHNSYEASGREFQRTYKRPVPASEPSSASASESESVSASGPTSAPASPSAVLDDLVKHLDPRAKWLAYILLTVAILFQSSWTGLIAASAVTVGVVLLSRVKIWETLRVLIPFFALIVISIAFAGVKFSGQAPLWRVKIAGFSWSAANVTFLHLFPFLLIMILGVLLPATTSQLRMKQGLEQSLQGLKKAGLPVEAFSLATSLTLRFIPIIMGELRRFSRIAASRGPRKRSSRGIPLRDVPAVVIPLLLSVLAIGDQLSTALEARGYRSVGQSRTRSMKLRFTRTDWRLAGLALITSLALMLFRL